jgi:hypothetical protein
MVREEYLVRLEVFSCQGIIPHQKGEKKLLIEREIPYNRYSIIRLHSRALKIEFPFTTFISYPLFHPSGRTGA